MYRVQYTFTQCVYIYLHLCYIIADDDLGLGAGDVLLGSSQKIVWDEGTMNGHIWWTLIHLGYVC